MHIDKTTLYDLSIFDYNEEQSLLYHLNFCRTANGRNWLEYYLKHPLPSVKEINERQQLLQRIIAIHPSWPESISNGSVLMIEKFYESQVQSIPAEINIAHSALYKFFNASDFSLVRYSVTHFVDFMQGMYTISNLLQHDDNPAVLDVMLKRIRMLLAKPVAQQMVQYKKSKKLSPGNTLHFGHFIRENYKDEAKELLDIYSKLDAFYAMATACMQYSFSFPFFTPESLPDFEAKQLYHPLLATPVPYDIILTPTKNFLFLTGANMAGKS